MKKKRKILWAAYFLFAISGCVQVSSPALTMEAYLSSVAKKDINQVLLLSCPEYIQTAQGTMDSFTSVDLEIRDLACVELESNGETATVNCKGKIIATYNGEGMDFDLSILNYQLKKVSGDWLVCGQK